MPEIQLRLAVPSDLEALVDLETRAMHFPMGHRICEWFRDDSPFGHRDRVLAARPASRPDGRRAGRDGPQPLAGVAYHGAGEEAEAEASGLVHTQEKLARLRAVGETMARVAPGLSGPRDAVGRFLATVEVLA